MPTFYSKQPTVRQTSRAGRRTFLKQGSLFVGGTLLGSFPAPFVRVANAATQITMLAWYGHAEKDIVAEFESRHNVKFKPKYYAGGDNMLALIAQSPPGTYDLILSDAEYVQQLQRAGYVEELDPTDYPLDDYWKEFNHFPGHWKGSRLYSVLTRFGFLGVAYNTTRISAEEASSYKVYWSPKVKGKLGHFDWYLPNMGQLSLYNGNKKPYNLSKRKWRKLKDKALSLRPQVGGFFDYGGTFASLKNGQMSVFCGIGDWITGVLEKSGVPVKTALPKEGGLQWTESFSIGKGSKHQKLARQFIQYITSPDGQVKSANMVAYPALIPNKKAWKLLQEQTPAEAARQRMQLDRPNVIDDIREGRVQFRELPQKQPLEDWNEFWSEYKNA